MAIDHKNPVPLYTQVANDIKAKINSGDLQVGDQLGSQQELAEKYTVSLITIKRALNDLNRDGLLYSRVGKGTYVANQSPRIDFSKHRSIGFVLRDLDSPFFSTILKSAEKKLSEQKYNLLVSNTAGKAEKEDSMINHFLDIGISGLIIASMSREYRATPMIRKLHEQNFPYAVVSYMVDKDISYVGSDHEEGAFIATKHLIKLGYKKIGYLNGISGDESSLLGDLRKKGYLSALRKYGIEYNPNYEYKFQLRREWNDYQSGYDIGIRFASSDNRPQAVFAFDDLTALGFQKAVLMNGLRVPDDVAIVGFDDIRSGVTAPVPLTTVHQPNKEIGKIAVDVVLGKINGQKIQGQKVLKPSLIVRDSCGAKLRARAIK